MCYEWNNSCSNYSTCMFPPPALLQLRRWELHPLENHNYPTCRVNLTEEPAAFKGCWLMFSRVKASVCISVFQPSLHCFCRMTPGLCKRQQAPTPSHFSSISTAWGSASGIHQVFSMGKVESWLLFHWATGMTFANAVVTEGLHCPFQEAQACHACRSLADKHFQQSPQETRVQIRQQQ